MSAQTDPDHLSITVAPGHHPCESEGGTDFFRDRMVLLAKVLFFISFGFFVLVNVVALFRPDFRWIACLSMPSNQIHLGLCGFLGALWVCYRGLPLSLCTLRRMDTGSMVLVGVLVAAYGLADVTFHANHFIVLLATSYTLIIRAVIVPSCMMRTLAVSAAASLPGIIAGSLILGGGEPTAVAGDSLPASLTFYAAWYVVAVSLASVASRVIYGLQTEVEQAQRLGQYTLEEKIGEGGMGEVYRASHAMLRRPTAIKLLRPERAGALNVARFEREVQLTSRLTHPNTIAIYDYGRTPEGTFYYAMEFLDGLSLDELVKAEGPLPPERVLHIVKQVASSLAEAHHIGLIHRDIKPANIVMCERGGVYDVAKVVDFGLVKDLQQPSNTAISAPHTITGTPLYMSPEAIRSPDAVGPKSDLYSLGCVGYYLLTGTHVFASDNFMEVCSFHLHREVESPSARLGRPVPPDLEGLLLVCLEKDAAQRPEDARSLKCRLEACADFGKWSEERAAEWWQARSDHARAKPGRQVGPRARMRGDADAPTATVGPPQAR